MIAIDGNVTRRLLNRKSEPASRSATGTGLLDPPPCLDRPGGLARKAAPASWKT